MIHHLLEPAGEHQVRMAKRYEVHGQLVPLFRFYYGPKVRRALGGTFAALEKEAAGRASERRK